MVACITLEKTMRKEIKSTGKISFVCNVARVPEDEGVRSVLSSEIGLEDVSTGEIVTFLDGIANQLASQAPDDEDRLALAVTLLSSGLKIVTQQFESNKELAELALARPDLIASLKQAARAILAIDEEVQVQPSTEEMIQRAMRGGGARA
jgi:hypothetical protein